MFIFIFLFIYFFFFILLVSRMRGPHRQNFFLELEMAVAAMLLELLDCTFFFGEETLKMKRERERERGRVRKFNDCFTGVVKIYTGSLDSACMPARNGKESMILHLTHMSNDKSIFFFFKATGK